MAPIRFPINDWDGNGSTDDLFDITMEMKISQNYQKQDKEDGILDFLLSVGENLNCDSYVCNDDDDEVSIEVEIVPPNEDNEAESSDIYKMLWITLSSACKDLLGLDFIGETDLKKLEEILNYHIYGWREKCESGSDYFLSPYKYKTESEYLAVLDYAKRIKKIYEAKEDELTENYYIDEKCKENAVYTYCGVVYEGNLMVYHYRVNDELIKPGDIVIVPCGQNNEEKEATVVSVGEYLSNAVPYPIEKSKKIIRKK